MKEIKAILTRYKEVSQTGKKCALATVVHLEGSSYRRPGARMLIEESGMLTGAISGGCLEGDALRKALHVMAESRAMLVTYDTMDDDDAKFGVGLGCNGIIQVLIEPIDTTDALNPISLLSSITERRCENIIVTLFDLSDRRAAQLGTCILYRDINSTICSKDIENKSLLAKCAVVMQSRRSAFVSFELYTAFIEYIDLPVSLIILGAGNDVFPVIEIANTLGWEPHVVDGRGNYATKDRFGSACSIMVSKPEKVLEKIQLDHRTVFLLMTHNYNYDLAMLRALLPIDTPYIGSLGPKKKLERMLHELKEEGIEIRPDQLNKLYGPTGLDIGAETPEEIALSIISEIHTILKHKSGHSLRDGGEVIHSRDDLKIVYANI